MYLAHHDIGGIAELVLVHCMVLDRSTIQPHCSGLSLDEQTSASIDGDLITAVISVDIMVRSPEPVILHIKTGSGRRDMHTHIGAHTCLGIVCGCDYSIRCCGTRISLQVTADEATDARMHVPESRRSVGWRSEVPLQQDGTSLHTPSG